MGLEIDPSVPVLALKAAMGLVSGSAVAAAAQRGAEGRDWIFGRSSCDHCQRRLSVVATTPLLGFALSAGRCRSCGGVIGWAAPAAEIAGLVVWLTPAATWSLAVAQVGLGLGLLYAALFDLRTLRIPILGVYFH